jgi:hypothetical protein
MNIPLESIFNISILQIAQKFGVQYHYFIRTYAYNIFEKVFYVIPVQGNI